MTKISKAACVAVACLFAGSAAFAGYDVKYTCVADHIPAHAKLIGADIAVEINPLFRRARIRDQVISQVEDGWHIVNEVWVRGATTKFSFKMHVGPSLFYADTYSSNYRYQAVHYRFSVDAKTGKFLYWYTYGHDGGRVVRVRGTCTSS